MTVKSSFAEVNLDVEPGKKSRAVELDPDEPFRILLMGDFSGRGGCDWKAIEIDRDNFDEVMEKVAPEFGGLRFREIDDFGPDAIYGQKGFQALREALKSAPAAPPAAPAAERPAPRAGMSLLDSMLEDVEPTPAPRPQVTKRGLEGVVDSIVSKYAAPAEDPAIARRRSEADAEAADSMRAILHNGRFQALEAAWRAVYRLVREVETDEQLKIYLLDVGKAELLAGLADGQVEKLLTHREWAWSAVAGNYTFGQSAQDAGMLGMLAKVMARAGAPFLAEADPGNGGPEWEELRQASEAQWIGLAMPRFLLRLPYGKKTVTTERFEFEEMPGAPAHGHYLWGNPAFACVQ
ncbi:MAG: type VI secretion system contractile sheath large subunit, partial [Candidatus Solibacter sp.]